MVNKKAKCYGQCGDCLYNFIDLCNAMAGDDFYVQISERQARLIYANRDRFKVSEINMQRLNELFPTEVYS